MRYLRLLSIFYRNSLYTEMVYRANFVANVLMSAFWLAFAILGLKVFFYHRDQIGAWSYYEAMLVVGFYSLFNYHHLPGSRPPGPCEAAAAGSRTLLRLRMVLALCGPPLQQC
jgi:hypothetical protein